MVEIAENMNKVEPVDTEFALRLLDIMKTMKNCKKNKKNFKSLLE